MEQTSLIVHDGVVVPESALLRRDKVNKYGSVPGIPDEELAAPDELERQVMREEFGLVLALPVRGNWSGFRPGVDESGGVDWGAFGTVDFERSVPEFDKARYKVDRLREELRDVLIMLGIVKRRVPGRAKYAVLKYLRMGVIGLEHVVNDDMLAVARYYLRARRIQREIASLAEARRERERRQVQALFG